MNKGFAPSFVHEVHLIFGSPREFCYLIDINVIGVLQCITKTRLCLPALAYYCTLTLTLPRWINNRLNPFLFLCWNARLAFLYFSIFIFEPRLGSFFSSENEILFSSKKSVFLKKNVFLFDFSYFYCGFISFLFSSLCTFNFLSVKDIIRILRW